MENHSENSIRQFVESRESVCNERNHTRVYKNSISRKFHQPKISFTHTKEIRHQIQGHSGKTQLNAKNLLWRRFSREKASWIR